MNNFVEIPASKMSILKRSYVYGVGVNDACYIVGNGANVCPFYRKWSSMLSRCYNHKLHDCQPTYAECTVTDEWLIFSNFKRWMNSQDWAGMDLDKDLLIYGNKIYSAEFCIFIPKEINSMLTERASRRGDLPIGVSFHKGAGKFSASCSVNGKSRYLGLYFSPELASIAYKKFKSGYIKKVAEEYKSNTMLREALINRAELLLR